MDAILIPYKKEHGRFILANNFRDTEEWMTRNKYADAFLEGWEQVECSYTIIVDEKIVACAGVYVTILGTGEAWTLFSNDLYKYPKSIYKAIKEGLERVIEEKKLRRVQAQVGFDNSTAQSFIKHLGFTYEGTMRKAGPNGENMLLYARIT
jgi:hypothetical protein